MKKIAFILFLLLFIAAIALPVFARSRRGQDRGWRSYVVSRKHNVDWDRRTARRLAEALRRHVECPPPKDDPSDDPTDGSGGGKEVVDPVTKK